MSLRDDSLGRSPRVSVVMPAHNAESFIEQAISSILYQSYKDFELLVVDDSSDDATSKILERLTDSRVRILTMPERRGVTHSLNAGLRSARGDFIARLDADDIADPERLKKQVEFLDSNPLYGLVGSWMRLFGARDLVSRYPTKDSDIRATMLFRTPFGHPSVMFRRKWEYGKLGLYNEEFLVGQDFDMWERIARLWKVANLAEILTMYRLHSEQVSSGFHRERHFSDRQVIGRQWERLNLEPPFKVLGIFAFFAWIHQVVRLFSRAGQLPLLRNEIFRFWLSPLRKLIGRLFSRFWALQYLVRLKDDIHECRVKLRRTPRE